MLTRREWVQRVRVGNARQENSKEPARRASLWCYDRSSQGRGPPKEKPCAGSTLSAHRFSKIA